jgi:hypothetical protein
MDITSSMTGFNQGIVVPNSYGIELYIKGGTNYYRLTCVYKPKTSDYSTTRLYSSDDVDTQNLWEFTLTPKAGEPGATSNPSELSYAELFTYDSDTDFTGSEIYIKKGSPLHNYIVNTGHTYINTRKPWLYFGKLYPKNEVDSSILVETYSMKDYALDALPEHQRSNNIREFFGVAFDGMYSQVYYKIREILTLSDPWEVREDYLHYLLQTFGITSIMPSGSTEYDLDRFLIQNLPALLKRKGTYDALQGFFRFLTRSTNRLNIYEQWHELLPSGAPYPYDSIETYCTSAGYDWQEHLWTKYYDEVSISAGAGLRYYNDPEIHYDYPYPALLGSTWTSCSSGATETDPPTATGHGDLRISPHYRVEVDLSTEPIQLRKIIDADTYTIMLEKFEQLRPVARFCETYGCVMKLDSDFTGRNLDTYDGLYTAFARTKCLRPVYGPLPGNYIFSNRSNTSTTLNIYHALGTKDLLVQLYINNESTRERMPYTRFIPKNIIIVDEDNITIELEHPQRFYAFIASDYSNIDSTTVIPITGSSPYDIPDSIYYTPILEILEEDDDTTIRTSIYPAEHGIEEPAFGQLHYMDTDTPDGNSTYYEIALEKSYVTGSLTGSTSYIVEHDLKTPGILVEVFELFGYGEKKKVMAEDIIITSIDTVEVYVESSTSDYEVVVKKITDWAFLRTIDDLMYELDTLVLGEGLSTATWNPLSTPSGSLQDEISPSAYEVESFVLYNANSDYPTYNVKAVVNILENINITEAGLVDKYDEYGDKMIFYTSCSPIEALKGTRLVLYFEFARITL